MERIIKKHHSVLVILCMICHIGNAQAKGGVENYNLLRQGQSYVWMPVLHYQTKKGIYSELRYNYEEMQTLSLFGGKMLAIGKKKTASIIPMIGLSTGGFSGISFAANSELELNDFFISSEAQYSVSFKNNGANFFFSWSELGYTISPNLFAGLSLQYSRQEKISDPEPGLMLGLSFKNFSIPVYFFNPFNERQYIVVGLNYEYHLTKK